MGEIASALAKLQKDPVITAVAEALRNDEDPIQLIEELRQGLDVIGELFENGEYYLLELIMAGEIFKDAAALITPKIQERYGGVTKRGKVLVGTVAGDIHDLGKNIVATLLECAQFEIIDLGVDVPAEIFVAQIKEHHPKIVGLSGLLTASIMEMNKIIEAIEQADLRQDVKVIVGGGVVGEVWTRGKLKADAAATNVAQGIKTIESWIQDT
jgi:methylmalonyl-CoA mutase cobalamin-binding domain/chain